MPFIIEIDLSFPYPRVRTPPIVTEVPSGFPLLVDASEVVSEPSSPTTVPVCTEAFSSSPKPVFSKV